MDSTYTFTLPSSKTELDVGVIDMIVVLGPRSIEGTGGGGVGGSEVTVTRFAITLGMLEKGESKNTVTESLFTMSTIRLSISNPVFEISSNLGRFRTRGYFFLPSCLRLSLVHATIDYSFIFR
jgi:hypothetical protein